MKPLEVESRAQDVWSQEQWATKERLARGRALLARSEQAAWRVLNREARRVMRAYTTSFYIVSRFLPRAPSPARQSEEAWT